MIKGSSLERPETTYGTIVLASYDGLVGALFVGVPVAVEYAPVTRTVAHNTKWS